MLLFKRLIAVTSSLLLFLLLFSNSWAEPSKMTIAGAGANLAITRILADAFIKTHPGVVIDIPASIGSTGGIKAAADGAVTIGLASRPLKESEKSLGLSVVPYARTIIIIGVHPSVSDTSLTYAELVQIYEGKQTRWKDGKEIIVLTRNDGESTIDLMNQIIPGFREAHSGSLQSRRWIVLFTDQDMNKRLSSTPQAIGMTDHGEIITEHLNVKELVINGIAPTPENVKSGAYPLSKTLCFVFRKDKITKEAQLFIDFVISGRGQKILKENGYLAGE